MPARRSPLLLLLTTATALAGPIALVGATIHPVSTEPIEVGVVLIEDDRIAAVGDQESVSIPEDAEIIDVTGKVIIPGLIDLHSHIGGGRLHDHLAVAQPGLSAADAIDPSHISIQRAQAGGVTTANVMPGSGKLMGGQTVYLDLIDTRTIDNMLRCTETAADEVARWGGICGGMKMANGTNPQGNSGDPASRMGSAYLQRQTLQAGVDRLAEYPDLTLPKRKRGSPPEPEPAADALAQIIAGERIVHFHTHRADDIITALRLRETFGFQLVIQHGSEGFKVTDALLEAGVPVAINVLDTPGGKEETVERRLDNPAILDRAGVPIALISDDPVQDSRLLLRTGGLAVRGGLPAESALRALTLAPAEMIGLADHIGSLEVGKEADLVVLSGPPLSTWSLVQQTWNNGAVVFDRATDAAHATGGDERIP